MEALRPAHLRISSFWHALRLNRADFGEPSMIRLSENFRALFYAPFYAAHATGAFKEAGVEVELVASPSPTHTVKALRAGEIDVMWGGPLRVMMSRDAEPNSDLVCFC